MPFAEQYSNQLLEHQISDSFVCLEAAAEFDALRTAGFPCKELNLD
jgi:hypothetical protein